MDDVGSRATIMLHTQGDPAPLVRAAALTSTGRRGNRHR